MPVCDDIQGVAERAQKRNCRPTAESPESGEDNNPLAKTVAKSRVSTAANSAADGLRPNATNSIKTTNQVNCIKMTTASNAEMCTPSSCNKTDSPYPPHNPPIKFQAFRGSTFSHFSSLRKYTQSPSALRRQTMPEKTLFAQFRTRRHWQSLRTTTSFRTARSPQKPQICT